MKNNYSYLINNIKKEIKKLYSLFISKYLNLIGKKKISKIL